MSINYDCTCESEQKCQFSTNKPICVTVSSEKVLKLIQFQTQTIPTHVAKCYGKLTIGHN